ncbi:MAG TPA: MBOAT family O-acyltransferase [Minicystis sp.]|nr:MBOAT family O-acyltransferase [Minicystis sp.]
MITSAVFWAFLVGAVVVHWLLPERLRTWFLFVASATYLAWLDWKSVLMLLVLSGLFYAVAHVEKRPRGLTAVLVLGVLAFLAWFKYVPVYVEAVRGRIEDPHARAAAAVLVPLGASYYTFKLIHYVIETGRKALPKHGPATFFAYMFFFPMFTAGPIERFDRFHDGRAPKLTREHLVDGTTRIMYGLVKKLVIVDLVFARPVRPDAHSLLDAIPIYNPALSLEQLMGVLPIVHPLFVWQFVINHFVAVYLDFSAYSDIAVGAGLLFGVRLMENFDYPLFATNISDFWRRWHISLSNYCREYVYMPVIGLTRNPYAAIFMTMAAIGLWHAGSWNYLCWGLFHAGFLVVYHSYARLKRRYDWEVDGRLVGLAGAVFTLLVCSAAQAFVATQPFGIRAAFRVLAALVGVHLAPAIPHL